MEDNYCLNGEPCPVLKDKTAEVSCQNRIDCTIIDALKLINGKWKLPIICTLTDKTMRYNELKREIVGITGMMLSSSLKELEESGIIHREAYEEVPPRVEYSLTGIGQELAPILFDLGSWSIKLKGQIK
ncbi:MAG: winged helix-turn-helix transcriptional regulator [Eubacteriaceae bacterium]